MKLASNDDPCPYGISAGSSDRIPIQFVTTPRLPNDSKDPCLCNDCSNTVITALKFNNLPHGATTMYNNLLLRERPHVPLSKQRDYVDHVERASYGRCASFLQAVFGTKHDGPSKGVGHSRTRARSQG